ITGRKQGRSRGDSFLQPPIAGEPTEVRLGLKSPCRPFQSPTETASPALACAQQKTGNGCRRAGSRSFGEYIFLEDSRYASQRKNTAPKRIYPACALRCRSG